jgi:hypothetical protein
MILVGG